MDTLEVALGARSYQIFIGSGLLSNAELLSGAVSARQALIVTNSTVAPLHLEQLQRGLDCEEQRVHVLADGDYRLQRRVSDAAGNGAHHQVEAGIEPGEIVGFREVAVE